jgi:uncharacterized protein (DUF1015 family)
MDDIKESVRELQFYRDKLFVTEVVNKLAAGAAASAILIRPVSLAEIRRTADTGELMPPKSTFFTPKLRTGMVMRDLN